MGFFCGFVLFFLSKTLLSESTFITPLNQAEHVFPFLKSGRMQDQLLIKYITVAVFVFSNFFCNEVNNLMSRYTVHVKFSRLCH